MKTIIIITNIILSIATNAHKNLDGSHLQVGAKSEKRKYAFICEPNNIR